jgi:hypothetical protein
VRNFSAAYFPECIRDLQKARWSDAAGIEFCQRVWHTSPTVWNALIQVRGTEVGSNLADRASESGMVPLNYDPLRYAVSLIVTYFFFMRNKGDDATCGTDKGKAERRNINRDKEEDGGSPGRSSLSTALCACISAKKVLQHSTKLMHTRTLPPPVTEQSKDSTIYR